MEAKLDQLRSLVEAADRDKVELLNQLEEEKRWVMGLFSFFFSSPAAVVTSESTFERGPDDCPCLTEKWKICSSVWRRRASPKETWR